MSVSVHDLLKLPSLRLARVVAGRQSLTKRVTSISVLESAEPSFLVDNVFALVDRVVREVMVPRVEMVCLYKGQSKQEMFQTIRQSSHMWFPYCGKDKDEIAENLFLSPHTVKNHIKSAYCKLGIHEKSEFIKYANAHNLFSN